MGMFDWYQPEPELNCPVCGTHLVEWQGKEGPNGLFVWRQGSPAPVSQGSPDDPFPIAIDQQERLPAAFELHSYDCERHYIQARGAAPTGVWSETKIVKVEERASR